MPDIAAAVPLVGNTALAMTNSCRGTTWGSEALNPARMKRLAESTASAVENSAIPAPPPVTSCAEEPVSSKILAGLAFPASDAFRLP